MSPVENTTRSARGPSIGERVNDHFVRSLELLSPWGIVYSYATNHQPTNSPLSTVTFVLVLGSDLIKGRDQLVEGFSVDDEARGTFW